MAAWKITRWVKQFCEKTANTRSEAIDLVNTEGAFDWFSEVTKEICIKKRKAVNEMEDYDIKSNMSAEYYEGYAQALYSWGHWKADEFLVGFCGTLHKDVKKALDRICSESDRTAANAEGGE